MKSLLILLILLSSSVSFAGPSCSTLNEFWRRLHNTVEVLGWDSSSFNCPSQEASVAASFLYLSSIEIIDPDSGEKLFDYENYVMSRLDAIAIGNPGVANLSASDGFISIGSSIYDNQSVGVEAPAAYVHERKHMDDGRQHVKCNASDPGRSCEAKFHLMSSKDDNFDANIDNPDVGAYSLTVTYLADFYNFGDGHDLSRNVARLLTQVYMLNHFKRRSSSNPEGLTNQQLVQALSRVDAQ